MLPLVQTTCRSLTKPWNEDARCTEADSLSA